MLAKGAKLYSITKGKCPRCHEGDFYLTKNPYNLKKFDKMYQCCSQCGQSFEMETGFYYGAMYVSYGLSVAFGIAVFVAQKILFDLSLEAYLTLITILLLAGMPPFYRLSRLIWINMFVKYDAEAKNRKIADDKLKGQPAISKF
jgi:uncharacterized protein (DUF983 family)